MTTMDHNFEDVVDGISQKDPRYKSDAYVFVMDALSFAQRKFKCKTHVTGEQLLVGSRELLVHDFGPMTIPVLRHWGIKNTQDFGNIVFNMVEARLLSKTNDDCMDSFRDFYDFDEVFIREYRRKLARKISRMRV